MSQQQDYSAARYQRPCKQIYTKKIQHVGQHVERESRRFCVYLRSSQWGYLRSLSFLSLARIAPPSLCSLTNRLSSSTSFIRVLWSTMHCFTICQTKQHFKMKKAHNNSSYYPHIENLIRACCCFVKIILNVFFTVLHLLYLNHKEKHYPHNTYCVPFSRPTWKHEKAVKGHDYCTCTLPVFGGSSNLLIALRRRLDTSWRSDTNGKSL